MAVKQANRAIPDGPRGTEDSSVFQQKQGPKTRREKAEKSLKIQTQAVRILQPLDGKAPSKLLRGCGQALAVPSHSRTRHSRFLFQNEFWQIESLNVQQGVV